MQGYSLGGQTVSFYAVQDSTEFILVLITIANRTRLTLLLQAKKFVESTPQVVKADISKEEAEKLKELLVASGAEIALD